MATLLGAHSVIRWLILAVGLLAILRAGWGYLSRLPFERMEDILGAAFTGFLDLNALIGLILFVFQLSGRSRPSLVHPFAMLLAVVAAHGTRRIASGRTDPTSHLYQGAGFLLSFILILIGVQLVA